MPLLHQALRWLAPAAFAAAMMGTQAQPADAAIISLNYTISGTGFTGGTPSVDPATISFSVTFDDTVSSFETAGLTVHSANFAIGSVLTYFYNPSSDEMDIGGGQEGAALTYPGLPDFWFVLSNVSTSPSVLFFVVSGPESANLMIAQSVTFAPFEAPQATPEPASLALFGVAMAALGTLRPRRKHRQAA